MKEKIDCLPFDFKFRKKSLKKKDQIFTDLTKVKFFSKIQRILCELEPNCKEEEIDKIINQIPKSYLSQKEDLLVICRTF